MKTKKKNPQDATLRNIRALSKRVAKLEAAVKTIWYQTIGKAKK